MHMVTALIDFDTPSDSTVDLGKAILTHTLIQKIVTGEGEIDIALAGLPSSEAMTLTQQQLSKPG